MVQSNSGGVIMAKILLILSLFIFTVGIAEARRGCCSWHGGVAGCDQSARRLVCRDGTYSPSCGCVINQPTEDQPLTVQASMTKGIVPNKAPIPEAITTEMPINEVA